MGKGRLLKLRNLPVSTYCYLLEPEQSDLETELLQGCLGLEVHYFKSGTWNIKDQTQQGVSIMQGD